VWRRAHKDPGVVSGLRLCIIAGMDKTYLQDVAGYNARRWWNIIRKHYPELSPNTPRVVLNNRLKTTAGRAFIENNPPYIDLSTELFWEYTEQFTEDTIPHELAHIAAYILFGDSGHGKGWYTVLNTVGIKTTRLHHMVNTKHAQRKSK